MNDIAAAAQAQGEGGGTPGNDPDRILPGIGNDLFRLMVESVVDYAIFVLDPSGIVRSWNSGAERIKGYSATEIIGHHFSRFYPEEAIRVGWPQLELESAKRDGRFEDEGWRVRKDGSRFWANVLITALHDPQGGLRGFAKITRDMSERKRVERLESDAQKMSEFVAVLAHELRNPLAPIRNAITLAQRPSTTPERVSWALQVVERQATQLTRLVDDLLDVSRITRGHVRLDRRDVSLAEVVQRAVEAVNPQVGDKKQKLLVALHAREAVVRGDVVRLTQVVTNLLNNASKYTPNGGRIELTLEQDDGNACILVRDTGVGIAPDLLPRIFDLFTQEDRSLDRSEGGLGLGLAIALRLVEMHGGTIHASSAGPGCGSTFTLTLPLAAAEHAEQAQGQRSILIVDDNIDAATTLQALFEGEQQNVLVAHDGEEALRLARAEPPDMVLLDIGLPGMSGYEVARQMRSLPGLREVLLVAVTGYGSDEDRRRSLEAGFDLHVSKPVDHDALVRRISEWMQR